MQRMKDAYENRSLSCSATIVLTCGFLLEIRVDFKAVDSIHSVSGLLEKWLRELPEPLTTHALYEDLMTCTGTILILLKEVKSIY